MLKRLLGFLFVVSFFAVCVLQEARCETDYSDELKAIEADMAETMRVAGAATEVILDIQKLAYAIHRMTMDGKNKEDLAFNSPDHFDALTDVSNGVFHPDGGGATYFHADGVLMQSGEPGVWVYNAENVIPGVNLGGENERQIIAFLPGVTEKLCSVISEDIRVENVIPVAEDVDVKTQMVNQDGKASVGPCKNGCGHALPKSLHGKGFGCFKTASDELVYYHVIH